MRTWIKLSIILCSVFSLAWAPVQIVSMHGTVTGMGGGVSPCSSYKDKPSLKAYWLFENNLNDSSGNGYTLTSNPGAATYESGSPIEGSYSIDLESGSQQYLSISNAAFGTFPSTFTVLGKFRLESIPSVSVLVSKWYHVDNQRTFQIRVETGGAVTLWHSIELDPYYLSTTVSAGLTTGVNYAFAYSYSNATRDYRFEVYNLDTSASTVVRTGTWSSPIYISTADFMIGNRQGATYYFDGVVDEVAVLSEAMTATEISEFFTGECSEGSTPGGGGEEPAYDHIYYVSQSGTDTSGGTVADGAGPENPYSALQINGGYIAGDYSNSVFYCIGTFTSRLDISLIHGSVAGNVVWDGYAAGDCDPINAECTGSAVLNAGMEIGNASAGTGPDYITIQDFRMTRTAASGVNPGPVLYILAPSGQSVDYYKIRRNYIHDSNGTLFYVLRGDYWAVTDNKIVTFGLNNTDATQGVNLIDVDHAYFARNEMGHDGSANGCVSANIVEIHGSERHLWEYNDIYGAPQQAGWHPKEDYGTQGELVFRFNKVHGNGVIASGRGLYSLRDIGEDNTNLYWYGNYVYENANSGIVIGDGTKGLWCWSNIVADNGRLGFNIYRKSASADLAQNVYIYNNTIVGNNTSGETDLSRGGVYLSSVTSINFENNIFYGNRPTDGYYYQFVATSTPTTLEHNTYYHPSGTANFYYSSAARTLAAMQGYGFENDAVAGEITNPGLTNPSSGDYTLTGATSLGRDTSASLTCDIAQSNAWLISEMNGLVNVSAGVVSMDLGEALDPDTDWSGQPSSAKILTLDRDSVGWDRGAYAYE